MKEIKKEQIMKELMRLKNIGPKMAVRLYQIGIRSVSEFRQYEPEELYERLNEYLCYKEDRCVLYIFRGARHNLPWSLCSDRHWKGITLDTEEANLAGCCGLYCGLCPRFQSTSKSRCPGCRISEHHSWCKVYRCCVIKKGYVTCADCTDYPCEKLFSVLGTDEDSFLTHKPVIPNLDRIKEVGGQIWLNEQKERQLLLEKLLENYNDGRAMSFYCLACTLMPIDLINRAVSEMERKGIDAEDIKLKAKNLKSILQDLASASGIELKLRRNAKGI